MHLKNAHTPVRCMICAAKFNPSADIAVGDAYGYEGEDASQGLSALLVRTETGREMLHEAADALNLTATSPERLLEGHEQVDCEVSVRAFEALVGFPSAPRAPAGEAPAAAVADIRWRMRVESAESEAEAVRMTRRKLRAEWLRRMLRMPLGLAKRIMRILARGGRA
jgi:coenzyme F420-reducing hydrogenase beta subunit